ncbi:MAG: tRNA (adenosine(37)-N6)-threonylcarbamoyltransferase complex ATPase subunit type 1 TsaE [Myxococcota bacterium]
MRFRCADIEATRVASLALSHVIDAKGLTLSLIGPLGAGKTAFVKGLAEGLGIDPAGVSSPTFVIANQYASPDGRQLAHVDLYRLETVSELDDVGFLDMLEPGAIVAVEWGDRLPDALPRDRLELRVDREAGAEESRSFAVSATGRDSQRVLEAWQSRLREASDCSSARARLELVLERVENG